MGLGQVEVQDVSHVLCERDDQACWNMIGFSWCAAILQVVPKHLLEEGKNVCSSVDELATLEYESLLFTKFNVKA